MGADRLTILVGVDDVSSRELFRGWLGDRHEVREATDGTEALEELDASVDIFLLDRDMPGLGAETVVNRVSTGDHDPHVVLVSSIPIDHDLATLPVHDYVRKPLTVADLDGIIDEFRARQDYESALAEYFSITSTVAEIEAERTPRELADDERYERLRWLAEEKRVEVDRALRRRDGDWPRAFRSLDPSASPDPPSRPV